MDLVVGEREATRAWRLHTFSFQRDGLIAYTCPSVGPDPSGVTRVSAIARSSGQPPSGRISLGSHGLLDLLKDGPFMLSLRFSLLSQATSSVLFSDRGNLHLAAWSISSGGSCRDAFWRRLQAWPRPSGLLTARMCR